MVPPLSKASGDGKPKLLDQSGAANWAPEPIARGAQSFLFPPEQAFWIGTATAEGKHNRKDLVELAL